MARPKKIVGIIRTIVRKEIDSAFGDLLGTPTTVRKYKIRDTSVPIRRRRRRRQVKQAPAA